MLSGNGASVYHPRQPQQSPLWKLLDTHYEKRIGLEDTLGIPLQGCPV